MEIERKPKLLFFQWVRDGFPEFIRLHGRQHVRCLEQFFEVAVIDGPCDYQEVCDRHQPDLALFESGVYVGKRGITSISAYPHVPKLGLCNCDAYCETREVFISDMAAWGVNTFFTPSVSMGEYTPEIAGDLFVWPNFVDESLYRDYGESKVIPVLFTGSQASNYPWRSRICKTVSEQLPSLICPHFGWDGRRAASAYMISGEPYARMLNASWVVPACGTIAKEVVRKHFEVPACRACLVAEKTSSLQAAGFVDFENCVFAEESDVLDKLAYLFRHSDELLRITDCGYRMVHDQHTAKQRDQIYQWFHLYQRLGPNERIVQAGPFEQLVIVNKQAQLSNSHITSNGVDRDLLRRGDEKLWSGRYEEAELLYLRCLNYQQFIPEPKLRLAICNLYRGNAAQALKWLAETIRSVVETYTARDPDPVEWAYLILSLLCQGRLDEASTRANQFSWVHHRELDRMRFAVRILGGQVTSPESNSSRHYSLHQLPETSLDDWIDYICDLLRANQQAPMAEKLRSALAGAVVSDVTSGPAQSPTVRQPGTLCSPTFDSYPSTRLGLGRGPRHARFRQRLTERAKEMVCGPLHWLERTFGYFLPYRYSWMKTDEFLCAVRQIARQADVSTALLIGAAAGTGTTEAFIAGILENLNSPTIFCTSTQSRGFKKLQNRYRADSPVKCMSLERVTDMSAAGGIDLVLVDGSELADGLEYPAIPAAKLVVLEDINTFRNYRYHSSLLADRSYRLVAQNPGHRKGYAIFEKLHQPSLAAEVQLSPAKMGNA
ncbi:MAG: glycosyltransferase [Terriglobales bacterium]